MQLCHQFLVKMETGHSLPYLHVLMSNNSGTKYPVKAHITITSALSFWVTLGVSLKLCSTIPKALQPDFIAQANPRGRGW